MFCHTEIYKKKSSCTFKQYWNFIIYHYRPPLHRSTMVLSLLKVNINMLINKINVYQKDKFSRL